MKPNYLILIIGLFVSAHIQAQDVLKGSVYEKSKNEKLANVFVKDVTNKQITITDNNGNFSIRTATGHTLIFNAPGYVSDTLYITDMRPKRIDMISQTISLRQVNVSATREAFDPRKEYPEVYTKSRVSVMSPSTWFSKEGKDARRLKRYFKREEEERQIDEAFNVDYVKSVIPLRGAELENFMSLYRPSYAFLKNNNAPSMTAYINDAYKKYQALPANKKVLPKLAPAPGSLQ
ncbi:carboxypeptidase-like regulatory domain-containing protein [Mucilaginibacter sp. AW1-7]|jgi:hypothetical protein|uniref:carboxypeptidase-like regulatory domain-containing protein n=1 Tax=unclassified Mucilaginibacter TaxID=2617802 RepID=UPI002365FDF4|nr:carboxypeptidase-like regulatory domain-containing protein [Mucilaginibacter sp. KACC 22773]WDF79217.1 carboxypeptidase-like regulatory domain-containing protein [Mucilaginibacter sp. KACC 22773]